jgi:hypothetical protein
MSEPESVNECSRACGCYPPVGTRVVVVDGSEAHGDEGVVWQVANGLCLVELDTGCIWPVSEVWEIRPLCG